MSVALLCLVLPFVLASLTGQHAHTTLDTSQLEKKHSFIPPYDFTGTTSIRYWYFGGHTVVTDKYIRLAPDRQSRAGYVYNSQPFNLLNWEIIVSFRVQGAGQRNFGDGFALWLLEGQPFKKGQDNKAYGGPIKFSGLAIVFDTYDNDGDGRNPFVGAILGDGEGKIDVETDASLVTMERCQADFRGAGHATRASIRYFKGTLTVDLDIKGNDLWETCLEVTDLFLPTGFNLALSASTGDVADNHDILSLATYDLGGKNPYQITDGPMQQPYTAETSHHEGAEHLYSSNSMFWSSMLITMVLTSIGLAFVAWRLFRQKSKSNKFRL